MASRHLLPFAIGVVALPAVAAAQGAAEQPARDTAVLEIGNRAIEDGLRFLCPLLSADHDAEGHDGSER